jgi:hypothetical protein
MVKLGDRSGSFCTIESRELVWHLGFDGGSVG